MKNKKETLRTQRTSPGGPSQNVQPLSRAIRTPKAGIETAAGDYPLRGGD